MPDALMMDALMVSRTHEDERAMLLSCRLFETVSPQTEEVHSTYRTAHGKKLNGCSEAQQGGAGHAACRV